MSKSAEKKAAAKAWNEWHGWVRGEVRTGPSYRWVGRRRYVLGSGEEARRRRQIARGQLTASNGLI